MQSRARIARASAARPRAASVRAWSSTSRLRQRRADGASSAGTAPSSRSVFRVAASSGGGGTRRDGTARATTNVGRATKRNGPCSARRPHRSRSDPPPQRAGNSPASIAAARSTSAALARNGAAPIRRAKSNGSEIRPGGTLIGRSGRPPSPRTGLPNTATASPKRVAATSSARWSSRHVSPASRKATHSARAAVTPRLRAARLPDSGSRSRARTRGSAARAATSPAPSPTTRTS